MRKENKTLKVVSPSSDDRIINLTESLKGYWKNDVWDTLDEPFSGFRQGSIKTFMKKRAHFEKFNPYIKNEIKYYFLQRLERGIICVVTFLRQAVFFGHLAEFLSIHHKSIKSLSELDLQTTLLKWGTYLTNKGIKIKRCTTTNDRPPIALLRQMQEYFVDFYDDRDELDKEIWDVRKIPGAQFNVSSSGFNIRFTQVPSLYRLLVVAYLKTRIVNTGSSQCNHILYSLSKFFVFIVQTHPEWTDLNALSRKDIEAYLLYMQSKKQSPLSWEDKRKVGMVKQFIEYLQMASHPAAPQIPYHQLIWKEDLPKSIKVSDEVKFIPESVLSQLIEKLELLKPEEYIPIIVLLIASGWRINDILNLKYDACLDRTSSGWYLVGDISKTGVLGHRIPITDEVACYILAHIEEMKKKSSEKSNPSKYLFCLFTGARSGITPSRMRVQGSLNKLARKQKIVDEDGKIFYFKNHAFRHTKAVDLINNGMSLVHVQKWMAHASPEMTLRYARILDNTMRKSWEAATKDGIFRFDPNGALKKIDISEIENEDVIEWEYIRHNLDAVRMPLGYCMKPNKTDCRTQLNPCLTCHSLCTTTDFIPQYEREILETKKLIEIGKKQGRSLWVDKNEALVERLGAVLSVLKSGKTHHMMGKAKREYIGEEQDNARTT